MLEDRGKSGGALIVRLDRRIELYMTNLVKVATPNPESSPNMMTMLDTILL